MHEELRASKSCRAGLGAGRYSQGTRVFRGHVPLSLTSRAGGVSAGVTVRWAALARPARESVRGMRCAECVRVPTRSVAHAGAPPGEAQDVRLLGEEERTDAASRV